MEKTEYQTATENERKAVEALVRERDVKLVRLTVRTILEKLESRLELMMNDDALPLLICKKLWESELDT